MIVAEYQLSYTASEIDEKLNKVDGIDNLIIVGDGDMPENCKIMLVPSVEQEEVISMNLTDNERERIVQEVITALGTPVFGRIDENKNITISGNLSAGTYTVKYENADNSTTDIGTITIEG